MVFPARHLSIAVARPFSEVYAFASNPAHLPRWAAGLSSNIRQEEEDWVADSPMGQVRIRFAAPNPYGVLDHVVTLPTGAALQVPMRVLANNAGSEVIFTLFRLPDMSAEAFEADARLVMEDLERLKALLESEAQA